MADFPVVQLVPSTGQATIGDCGICAISTLADRRYEDVVAAAVFLVGETWKNGLHVKSIVAIADMVGLKLRRRRKYDLDADTGILTCDVTEHVPKRRAHTTKHVVVLMDGRIYDSDLRVWAVDAFREHYRAKFGELLEVV